MGCHCGQAPPCEACWAVTLVYESVGSQCAGTVIAAGGRSRLDACVDVVCVDWTDRRAAPTGVQMSYLTCVWNKMATLSLLGAFGAATGIAEEIAEPD
mgnify:CR=1 FL=1